MKLHLGRMNSKELAEWFGISENSFKRANIKAKKLEALKKYAEYHLEGDVRKNVFIDEIYEDTYVADEGSPAYQCVRDLAFENWSENGYDTCSRVAEKIFPAVKEQGHAIQSSTNYCYVRKGRNELYGSPIKGTTGTLGSCHYEWCKKDKEGNYIPLTKEEAEIARALAEEFGFTAEEGTYIAEEIQKGHMTKEKLWHLYQTVKADLFFQWKATVEERLKCPIYKCTKIVNKPKDEAFDL